MFKGTYLTISRVEPLRFQCCLATVTRQSISLATSINNAVCDQLWNIIMSVSWLLVLNHCKNASRGCILAICVMLTPWMSFWPPQLVNKWKMWFKIFALLRFEDIISHVKYKWLTNAGISQFCHYLCSMCLALPTGHSEDKKLWYLLQYSTPL